MANILGINISEYSHKEVLKKAADFLYDGRQHYIVTPNPEIILASHQDEEFFFVLNQADLSLADGFGLQIAGRLFSEKIPRVTGADITVDLLKMAADKGIRIMVLNWKDGLSQPHDISAALEKKFPGLDCAIINIGRDKFLPAATIEEINRFAPQILFNTLGFPYQEKLIFHNLDRLPSVKLALGIGGSFDFITGRTKRAPKIFRRLGLEWLWRLGCSFGRKKNPSARIKRIWQATFIFIGKAIRVRFFNPRRYRPNVACFLYKKEAGKKKVLILERRDEPGHWQLPQGGRDGQDAATAGRRELNEETGLDDFRTIATFKNVYRYSFPISGPQAQPGSRKFINDYKGQEQSLYIAEMNPDKNSEVKVCFWDHVDYRWVELDKLIETLHPFRRPGAEIFLEKFKSLDIN